jgi:hypothetical protein
MIRLPQRETGRVASAALLAATGLAMAAALPAENAAGAARPQEASIPLANQGGIRDWRADKDRGIWIRDSHDRWYYGRFTAPCTGLPFAATVRFKTGPSGELDRRGFVRARDTDNCAFTSLVRSDGPPQKADKKQEAKAAEPAMSAPTSPAPAVPSKPPPTG